MRHGGVYAPNWTLWKDPPSPLEKDPTTGWTSSSLRTGIVGIKLGMISQMTEWFNTKPLTAIHVSRRHSFPFFSLLISSNPRFLVV
jgi:hypothetical protein